MSKNHVIIYGIFAPNIETPLYIGSTTKLKGRERTHKSLCYHHKSVIPQYKYIRKYIPNKNKFKLEPICSVLKSKDRYQVEAEIKKQLTPIFDSETHNVASRLILIDFKTLEVRTYDNRNTLSEDLEVTKEYASWVWSAAKRGTRDTVKHYLIINVELPCCEKKIKKLINSKLKDIKSKKYLLIDQRLYNTGIFNKAKGVKAIHNRTKKEYNYDSLRLCSRDLNIAISHLSGILNNRTITKTYKGYSFEFVDSESTD